MVRVHIYIKGRVQRVFYRDWARRNAEDLGLTGWVRNMEDGRVEAVFEGSESKVSEMLERCKKGPQLSNIEHLDALWEKATGEFEGFEIIH